MDMLTTAAPESLPGSNLVTVDYVVIGVYFLLILLVGLWAMYRTDRSNVSGFFLAGRNISWFPVGASLFSSNIGSSSFVGLSGTGVATGIAVGAYEWNAMLCLFFLGWIFTPIYISSGVVTMPQYLQKRFGGERIQVYISTLSLLLYILTKVSADLLAGGTFIQIALGWNLYLSIIVLLVITGLYTITGGLAAVIYTDTVQSFIMVGGALAMMGLAFDKVGGYSGLEEAYPLAIPSIRPNNTNCGIPREDSFNVFRDAVEGDPPWPGITFGLTILATWYWCADQVIAQRTLAAKNLTHAKGGCVMAGFIKILPMYMCVMVGMIARVLFPDDVACATPERCYNVCGSTVGCSNIAYPTMIVEILPEGLRGLLLAAMIAALMSSLTSVFNSASTLFTCDIWQKVRRKASERELMLVGRMFMLFLVVISVAWVPLVQSSASGQLFDYIQSITSYLGPPIIVIFTMAIFWKRLNEAGAFWALITGLVVGFIRMILDFSLGAPLCGEPEYRPDLVKRVHYLYFAILLASITTIVAVLVSLVTPKIDDKHLYRLTWFTRYSKKKTQSIDYFLMETKAETKEKGEIEKMEEDEMNEKSKSLLMRAFDSFCGLSKSSSTEQAPSEEDAAASVAFIQEEPKPAFIVNVACLLMLCVMVFLFAYYG